ncbi:MAG: C4-type zinc ribbon domain-containing protein [Nitrospirota bacterium]
MNEQLKLLVELQKLDSEILSRARVIEDIPSRISHMQKGLKEAQAAHAAQQQRVETAEKKKREKERELDALQDRVGKLKARTSEIKDNKTYQAHLKEIEAAEKAAYEVEDGILDLMEAVERENAALGERLEVLEREKAVVESRKRELDEEVEVARGKLDALRAKRSRYRESLEDELYDEYMFLLKSQGGLAVTPAEDEICTGCNMNIMPQLFVEIKKNEDIIRCPQCRRILYYRSPEPQKAETPAAP